MPSRWGSWSWARTRACGGGGRARARRHPQLRGLAGVDLASLGEGDGTGAVGARQLTPIGPFLPSGGPLYGPGLERGRQPLARERGEESWVIVTVRRRRIVALRKPSGAASEWRRSERS
jgi:hypothetical protein